jgi:protein-tyrosine phosphatase
MNILFICTGNTCRSPIAEGLFQKMLHDKEGSYKIGSAGIYVHKDDNINDFSKNELLKRGIDFSERRAVQVTKSLIEDADLVFTMTSNQRRLLVENFPCSADKIHLLGDFTGFDEDVVDPYGSNENIYKKCADHIESMLKVLKKMV